MAEIIVEFNFKTAKAVSELTKLESTEKRAAEGASRLAGAAKSMGVQFEQGMKRVEVSAKSAANWMQNTEKVTLRLRDAMGTLSRVKAVVNLFEDLAAGVKAPIISMKALSDASAKNALKIKAMGIDVDFAATAHKRLNEMIAPQLGLWRAMQGELIKTSDDYEKVINSVFRSHQAIAEMMGDARMREFLRIQSQGIGVINKAAAKANRPSRKRDGGDNREFAHFGTDADAEAIRRDADERELAIREAQGFRQFKSLSGFEASQQLDDSESAARARAADTVAVGIERLKAMKAALDPMTGENGLMKQLADQTSAAGAAFSSFSDGVAAGIDAAITGHEGIGKAAKKAAAESLRATAVQAGVESLKHAAYALGSLAFGDLRGAGTHALAAAKFLGVAAAAGVGASALGAGGGGGGGRGGGSGGGGGGFVNSGGGSRNSDEGKTVIVNVYGNLGDPKIGGQQIGAALQRGERAGLVRPSVVRYE